MRKLTEKSINLLNKEIFPLFKIVLEDIYRFREVDSDIWFDAEEHELIRSGFKGTLYVKESYGDNWQVVCDSLPANLVETQLMIEKIKERYSYWKDVFVVKEPVMFVFENQVFKNPHVLFNQLCITGEPIEPEKYYCEEGRIKVNFLNDYVLPIHKDEVLMHGEQIYLNGELIYNREQLKELKPASFNRSLTANKEKLS